MRAATLDLAPSPQVSTPPPKKRGVRVESVVPETQAPAVVELAATDEGLVLPTKSEARIALDAFLHAKATAEALEKRTKALQAQLFAILPAGYAGRLLDEDGERLAAIVRPEAKPTVDEAAFKVAHPGLYRTFIVPVPTFDRARFERERPADFKAALVPGKDPAPYVKR